MHVPETGKTEGLEMSKASLLAVFLLWGGAAFGSDMPLAVMLTDTTLSVRLSDGTRCRVQLGGERLDQCGSGYAYRVLPLEHRNFLRRGFEAILPEGLLYPMARIVLTDMSGRQYQFDSPPADANRGSGGD